MFNYYYSYKFLLYVRNILVLVGVALMALVHKVFMLIINIKGSKIADI